MSDPWQTENKEKSEKTSFAYLAVIPGVGSRLVGFNGDTEDSRTEGKNCNHAAPGPILYVAYEALTVCLTVLF